MGSQRVRHDWETFTSLHFPSCKVWFRVDGGDEPPGERGSCCPGSHSGAEWRERDLDVCTLAPPWQGVHTSQEPREMVHRLLLSHPSILMGVVDTGSPTGPDASSLVLVAVSSDTQCCAWWPLSVFSDDILWVPQHMDFRTACEEVSPMPFCFLIRELGVGAGPPSCPWCLACSREVGEGPQRVQSTTCLWETGRHGGSVKAWTSSCKKGACFLGSSCPPP